MKIKFVVVFLLHIGCVFSQNKDILAPAPTASSLGKYIDNPVSYHTGTPNIQVPLYSIKLKEFTLPIGLSYNPQDIQVNTTPSNVGLGWSLNAGGVITRIVQNFPDDYREDQCDPNIDYDQSHDTTAQSEFSYCPWGYMYAISEGEPLIQLNNGYYGTPTYNLDLDAIYANRATKSPERAIIGNFAYPLWGSEGDLDGITNTGFFGREVNTMKMFADLEPDIFYFNFNGYSGKFVFDVENGIPRIKTIPYQDLDITYETDQVTGKLIGFKIIDENGNQYFFQDYEYTAQIENYSQTGTWRRTTYNSSWWLTKIITAGGDYLNFSYQDEKLVDFSFTAMPDLEMRWLVYGIPYSNPSPLGYLNGPGHTTKKLTDTKRLASIYNNTIQVNFQAEHTRTDLHSESTSKAITGVEINYKNAIGGLERIKKYKFEHDYFLGDAAEPIAYDQPSFPDKHHRKRLRLKSVQEYGETDVNVLPKCIFEYNYYDYTGNNTLKFPDRYTNNLDLWGYANGANNTTVIPMLHIYPDYYEKGDLRMYSVYEKSNYSGKHFTTLGGNRLPNINYGTIGVLTRIVYPTGGNTFYEYEAHRFLMDGEEYEGGGLRIKKIIKDDGEGKKIFYNYRYTKSINSNTTSGKIVSIPLFANFPSSIYFSHTQYELSQPNNATWHATLSSEVNRYRVLSGFCSSPMNNLGGSSNLGYTKVIEFMTESVNSQNYDNGRTEYTFSFPAALGDKNDILNGDCTLDENGICDGLYRTTRVHNFFMYGNSRTEGNWDFYPESSLSHLTPPNPNYDWARGQLLKEVFYNSTGSLVKENLYTYKNYFPNNQISPTKVYGFRMSEIHPYASFSDLNRDRYAFRVAKYEILTDVVKVLSLKTEIQYANNGTGSITTTNAYAYEASSHKNITKTTTNTSTSDQLITTYKYPLDYSSHAGPQEGMYALRNKKILSIPIEITDYTIKGGAQSLTGSVLNTYSLVNNIALPTRSFKLEAGLPISDFQPSTIAIGPGFFTKDSRYVEKVKYNRYDTTGNILEIEDKITGLTICYVWGYNNQYPIAKVVNATYDDIISVLGSSNLSRLNTGYKQVVITPPLIQKVLLTDAEIRSLLSPLRTNLIDAQVTIFTHKPLVGTTSVTDIKGETTYYEYDGLNRLSVVKDHNGNILSNNAYNYKNQ